jgi:hypothetical protein
MSRRACISLSVVLLALGLAAVIGWPVRRRQIAVEIGGYILFALLLVLAIGLVTFVGAFVVHFLTLWSVRGAFVAAVNTAVNLCGCALEGL